MRKNKKNLLKILKDNITEKEMNDFCDYIYEDCDCPKEEKTFNWLCFGKYKQCPYFKKMKAYNSPKTLE